jgi:hypothetical protein
MNRLSFFFSFELPSQRMPLTRRQGGVPEVEISCRENLLQSPLSLCRMVVRRLDGLAAPPQWIGQRLAGNGDHSEEITVKACGRSLAALCL